MESAGKAGRFTYRHSGLTVRSEIELPEWTAFAAPADAAIASDVTISVGEDDDLDFPADGRIVAEGESLRFAVEGLGGWEVEGGRAIRITPQLNAAPRKVRLFTLGSAWAALGYQRGLAMWHGSAVARGGRALLFCGEQGAGKSTMAAALLARGAALVADDLSRIDVQGEGAAIFPSSSRAKLWRSAIDHLGWQGRAGERDHFRENKFHCPVADHLAKMDRVPLAGIVVLDRSNVVECERLRGAEALTATLGATLYRPEMLEQMGKWPRQAALAARIVEHVPVWRLARPMDFAFLDAGCEAAEALWRSSGACGADRS